MLWFWVTIVAGLFLWPFVSEILRKPPDPREAPGNLTQLSQGTTHFQWFGPARGPVAVCVHGQTTPMRVYFGVAQELSALGYRVLTYDLYGRGFSSNAPGRQDMAFHLKQLEDLLEDQNLTDDLLVLGYSMGGAIATEFAAENPHRVRRLVILASAGLDVLRGPGTRFAIKVPILGDWLHYGIGMELFRRELKATLNDPTEVSGIVETQLSELQRRGFRHATLSSMRWMTLDNMERQHRVLGREGVPVVAIWGDRDSVIPLTSLGKLAQWNRLSRQEVAGAGHGLPYTHASEIGALLRTILKEKD